MKNKEKNLTETIENAEEVFEEITDESTQEIDEEDMIDEKYEARYATREKKSDLRKDNVKKGLVSKIDLLKDTNSMKKRRLKLGTYIMFFLIGFAAVIMFFSSDEPVNRLFLFIMIGFLALAYFFGLFRMSDLTRDILTATGKIKKLHKKGLKYTFIGAPEKERLFKTKHLAASFESYKCEMERLSGNVKGVHCDIGDYINEDVVENYSAKGLLGQISGIMTGLGILGTFIGLTVGLEQFDSSTAEAMASSITPLMEGIKVAFFTSIYGVIFSILFTIAYNYEVKNVELAIEEFLAAFYDYVVPDPDNDIAKNMVYYQQEEVKALKEFAKTMQETCAAQQSMLEEMKGMLEEMSKGKEQR